MIDNNELHKKLSDEGKLYSSEKDGLPKTLPQKLLGRLYQIILSILIIVNILLYKKLKDKINLKAFFATVIIGCIAGWAWGIVMEQFDPKFPAWLFHPWSYSGLYWLQALEDWVFYPICGIFFILICELIPQKNSNNNNLKVIILSINSILILMSFFIFKFAGISLAIMHGLPGVIFLILIYKNWNIKHYLICCTFFILFACIWDIFAVTWVHSIVAWAEQWTYIVFDAQGNYTHSKVFIDYSHKWAWIGYSPIEITPFLSIYGSMFIYGLYYFTKNLFKKA